MKRFLSCFLLVAFVFTALPIPIPASEMASVSEQPVELPPVGGIDALNENAAEEPNPRQKTAVSIVLDSVPKAIYWVGEALDVNNGMLTVTYDDGTKTQISLQEDMVFGFDSSESGSYVLTVSYAGLETFYEIEVFENLVTSIELLKPFEKTEYLEGETIDPTGCRIAVCYENGDRVERDVDSSMIYGYRSDITGEQQISVVYEGAELYVFVKVIPKTVEQITIANLPHKKVYAVGEVLDVSGGELSVLYNNQTSAKIPMQPMMISGFDTSAQGEILLTVNFGGSSTTFSVSVVSVLLGDLNFDGAVNQKDAVYLLYHLFLPKVYPVNQRVDYNLDGVVSDRDVLALLRGEIQEEEDGGDNGDEGDNDNGGGGLVDGPGIGTDVPPVGDFPFQQSRFDNRSSSALHVEMGTEALYEGKLTTLILSCNGSLSFSSAYVCVENGDGVRVIDGDWIDKGILSDVEDGYLRAVMMKEKKSVSNRLYSLTLVGDSVTESTFVRISVVLCDEKGNVVANETVETSLSVLEIPFAYGDINGDANIDDADYLLLLRHLNGWNIEIKRPDAMDVNVDGIVDSLDGLLLLRYVKGKDVSLGETRS